MESTRVGITWTEHRPFSASWAIQASYREAEKKIGKSIFRLCSEISEGAIGMWDFFWTVRVTYLTAIGNSRQHSFVASTQCVADACNGGKR